MRRFSSRITLWEAKESPKVVKFAAVIAELGGATMTSELQ